MHLDTICSQAVAQEFGELSKFAASRCGGTVGTGQVVVADLSDHQQHLNDLNHLGWLSKLFC